MRFEEIESTTCAESLERLFGLTVSMELFQELDNDKDNVISKIEGNMAASKMAHNRAFVSDGCFEDFDCYTMQTLCKTMESNCKL